MREAIIFYLKPFPVELPLARLSKRHEFNDIFQENDWCFDDKKPNLNAFHRISSHFVCDFRLYLNANDPNRFPFSLKSTFAFEIRRKKHLSTPKTAAKNKPIEI